MDEDGFYLGELNGKRGLVPSNFLQPLHDQDNQVNNYSMRSADPIKVNILSLFMCNFETFLI